VSSSLRRHRPARPALPRCDNPLVIAHRGASHDVAEHTLPAYLAAIEDGADGLECDVRLTLDGHLVCVHDRTVNRTSNGTGVVSELELAALRQLDFQSWHAVTSGPDASRAEPSPYLSGVAPDRIAPDSAHVLTLHTLLEVVHAAGRPLQLLVETKHPTRYGGLVEKELVRLLGRFGWAGAGSPVTVMSFAPVALRRVRLLAAGLPLVLLLSRDTTFRRSGTLPTGVHTAGPSIRLLADEPDFVARAHRAGNRVFSWTVDSPADVSLAGRLGIDAIITNRPKQTRAQLGLPAPTA